MKKKQHQQNASDTEKSSVFWKPETIGESVEGVFNGYEQTDKSNVIAIIDKKGSNHLVSISKVVLSFLKHKDGSGKELAKRLRAGKDQIKILLIGKKTVKRWGKEARIYRMWVNDIECEQDFAAKKIDADTVLNSVDNGA
jgi:hypothetical protein